MTPTLTGGSAASHTAKLAIPNQAKTAANNRQLFFLK
jgi:hypothetical protein